MARVCHAKNKSGEPCKARAMLDSDFCVVHDPRPESQKFTRERRAKGGKKKGENFEAKIGGAFLPPKLIGRPPKTVDEIRALISKILKWVLTGKIDHRRAEVAMRLCKQAMKLIAETDPKKEREEADQLTDEELIAKCRDAIAQAESRIAARGKPCSA